MVKNGVVIIDIGMGRLNGKICGDVDFEKVKSNNFNDRGEWNIYQTINCKIMTSNVPGFEDVVRPA